MRYSRNKVVFCFIWFLFGVICFFSLAEEYKYPYNSYEARDPLRPLVDDRGQVLIKEKKGVDDFVLQGVIDSDSGNQAIINNEIYKENDTVEGYRIKTIEKSRVILEKNNEEFILKWEG